MWCSFSESNRHHADVYFCYLVRGTGVRCSADPEKQDNQLVPTSTKMTCSGIDLVGYAIASLVLPNHPIEGQAGTMLTCCGTDLVGQAGA